MLGGGMRQAGVLAAAGILALTEQVPHLEGDHNNALKLAKVLEGMPGLDIDPDAVQTNMVFIRVKPGSLQSLTQALAAIGVLVSGSRDTLRLVTHFDFKQDQIDFVATSFSRALQAAAITQP